MGSSVRIRRRRPWRTAFVLLTLFAGVFAAVYVFVGRGRGGAEAARATGFQVLSVLRAGERHTFTPSEDPVPLCPGDVLEVDSGPVRLETPEGDRFDYDSGSRLSVGGSAGALVWKFDAGKMNVLYASGTSRIDVRQFGIRPESGASVKIESRDRGERKEIVVYSKLKSCEIRVPNLLLLKCANGENTQPDSCAGARIEWDLSGYRIEAIVLKAEQPVVLVCLKTKKTYDLGNAAKVFVSETDFEILEGTVAVRAPDRPPSVAAKAPVSPARAAPPAKPADSPKEPGREAPPVEPARPPEPAGPPPADPGIRAGNPPDPAPPPEERPPSPPSEPRPGKGPETAPPPETAPADPAPSGSEPVKAPPPEPPPDRPPSPAPEPGPEAKKPAPPPARPPAVRRAPGPGAVELPAVVNLKGAVSLVRDGRASPVPAGRMKIVKGDRIRVAAKSRAVVETRTGIRYQLEENSEFVFEE